MILGTITVYLYDTSNPFKLKADSTYKCAMDNNGGYGIIVIEDTLRMVGGTTVGTYADEGLILTTNGLTIDLKSVSGLKDKDLNATLLYLKTGSAETKMGQVTVLLPAENARL